MKDFAMSEFFEGTEVKSQVKKMGSVQNWLQMVRENFLKIEKYKITTVQTHEFCFCN
jgi:aminoglycoside phosphotransferase family enzyme